MRKFQDLLEEINSLDEHTSIEAKISSQMGKPLLKTVCSFSNEPGMGGGHLILGIRRVEENALFPFYEVVGVENADKLQCDIASQCASAFNIPVRPSISTEVVEDGKQVIVVHVPEAQPAQKPIYFKDMGLPSGAYRRIGSTDQRCSDDDLFMLYGGRQSESYDATILPQSDMTDLDPEAIEDYRKARAEYNPDAEELDWSDEDLLKALNCIKFENGETRPTIAGVLLFGTSQALRRLFPMIRADYIRVPGKEWIENPDDKFESIDMRGPLMRLIRRVQAAILDDLPRGIEVASNDVQREEHPILPTRAIREAVVNSLMHRDYRVQGPVQIIRYSNRIEFRNPGYSLKAEERLEEPGSESRNPCIAAVLHETKFAETKGSGIRVMRQKMEDAHLSPPTFESDREENRFSAYFLFHHFLGPDDINWLASFQDLNLADDDHRALIFVREVGAIDNNAYRNINHVDTLTASSHLRRLRDNGLLSKKEKGRATYYTPTERFLSSLSEVYALTPKKTPLTPKKTPLTPKKTPLTPKKTPLTPKESGLSTKKPSLTYMESAEPHPDSEARQRLLQGLSTKFQEVLRSLGARETEPENLRAAIMELCNHSSFTKSDLALILNRRPEHLARKYLRPMLKEGLLEYTIPENPNDRRQAYRTVTPPTEEPDSNQETG